MQFEDTDIPGCSIVHTNRLEDNRGDFMKTYHEEIFRDRGIHTIWSEEYFSTSHKDVIRGMHFQTPPYDHDKLVNCISGRVLDVVVDLRTDSGNYGKVISVELSGENGKMIFIPKGCAHGFLSLEDNSVMFYKVSQVYTATNDMGLAWDTIGIEWPVSNPIISVRDQNHPDFKVFKSPF